MDIYWEVIQNLWLGNSSTPEMIDAMNGYDSEWYDDYKTKCSRAYNCLRRHANVFMLLLSPLYKMTPANFK